MSSHQSPTEEQPVVELNHQHSTEPEYTINEEDIGTDPDEMMEQEQYDENEEGYSEEETNVVSQYPEQNMALQRLRINLQQQQQQQIDDNDEEVHYVGVQEQEAPIKKEPRIPKSILAGQKKYMEALEKQNNMKKKDSKKSVPTKAILKKPVASNTVNHEGMRRVIVAGRVKYIPIKAQQNEDTESPSDKINPMNSLQKRIPEKKMTNFSAPNKQVNSTNHVAPHTTSKIHDNTEELPKRIPSSLAKKMEAYNAKLAKETRAPRGKKGGDSGKKIPTKYAKHVDKERKQQTIKNVKNFSELRRITAIENLGENANFDPNRASMQELRKMKTEQRLKEQQEAKRRAQSNKRESMVQEILNNDKMSKFAKTVKIKNLSVNSRNNNKKRQTSETYN